MPTTRKPNTAKPASPAVRRELGRVIAAVLTAAEAGWLQLPADLAAAVTALTRSEQLRADLTAPTRTTLRAAALDTAATRAALIRDTADAIRNNQPVPDVDKLLTADPVARARTEHQVLDEAHAQLLADARRAATPEQLLTQHVRPALLELMEEARTLTGEHGDLLATTSENSLPGWRRFGELAAGYAMLRQTAAALTTDVPHTDPGPFAEWADPPDDPRLYGRSWYGRNMLNGATPWPTEPRARLLWIVRTGLDVWVPTAAERDVRWAQWRTAA
jgi:hypothetical protein